MSRVVRSLEGLLQRAGLVLWMYLALFGGTVSGIVAAYAARPPTRAAVWLVVCGLAAGTAFGAFAARPLGFPVDPKRLISLAVSLLFAGVAMGAATANLMNASVPTWAAYLGLGAYGLGVTAAIPWGRPGQP